MRAKDIRALTHLPAWALDGEYGLRHTLPFLACMLLCAATALSQAQQAEPAIDLPDAPSALQPPLLLAQTQTSTTPQAGSIRGTVLDRDGAMVSGATLTLAPHALGSPAASRQVTSGNDGTFSFPIVPPGTFDLTVSAPGFATEVTSITLHPGEFQQLSPLALHPGLASEVEVTLSRTEIAQDQIEEQEKQRVLGFIPNYYVSYIPLPLPLTPRQKAELAWKSTIDPFTILISAGIAGIEQADNALSGYGPGASGYGKRFGAIYGNNAINAALGGALLPIVLHQDPRFFVQGTGSARSRLLHAVVQTVIAKGDNGHWQPNYSGIGGSLAAAGIANIYLPSTDRADARTFLGNTFLGLGSDALGNVFQEFVVRHFTPAARRAGVPPSPPVSESLLPTPAPPSPSHP